MITTILSIVGKKRVRRPRPPSAPAFYLHPVESPSSANASKHWYNSATALLQVVHHTTSEHKIRKALEVRDFVFIN